MTSIKKLLKKEMFDPGLIGLILNPFFHARRSLVNGIKKSAHHLEGSLLDVGCGSKPYRNLFKVTKYTGLDTDSSGHDHQEEDVDVLFDGRIFPFQDKVFDSILCNQVLEHVFEPSLLLSESNRVLKVGGKCLFTVPFVWDEHEQPYDYARYSSYGLKYLFEQHGFKILEQYKLMNDFRVIIQLSIGYFYKLSRKITVVKQLVQLLIIFPLNVLGWICLMIPANQDLYLDNLLVAEKVIDVKS